MVRSKFRGRGLFGLQMFSPVIALIPLFEMMKTLQLLDTYTALILVNTAITLPFSIWMLRGFFKNIPEELEDAAPGLVTTAIFTFVSTWNEFIFALVLVSKRTMQPITMALYAWKKNNVVEWNWYPRSCCCCWCESD